MSIHAVVTKVVLNKLVQITDQLLVSRYQR